MTCIFVNPRPSLRLLDSTSPRSGLCRGGRKPADVLDDILRLLGLGSARGWPLVASGVPLSISRPSPSPSRPDVGRWAVLCGSKGETSSRLVNLARFSSRVASGLIWPLMACRHERPQLGVGREIGSVEGWCARLLLCIRGLSSA
jgi:hypothetical protein